MQMRAEQPMQPEPEQQKAEWQAMRNRSHRVIPQTESYRF
jgi:hypothetical protein